MDVVFDWWKTVGVVAGVEDPEEADPRVQVDVPVPGLALAGVTLALDPGPRASQNPEARAVLNLGPSLVTPGINPDHQLQRRRSLDPSPGHPAVDQSQRTGIRAVPAVQVQKVVIPEAVPNPPRRMVTVPQMLKWIEIASMTELSKFTCYYKDDLIQGQVKRIYFK